MQTYEQRRDQEQLATFAPAIATFVKNYRRGRPTVILLPGGKGSELRRSDAPFNPDEPAFPFSYTTSWLDLNVLTDLADLTMQGDADAGDTITVAAGDVEFMGITLYGTFVMWAAACNYNIIVFGWDWRRRLTGVAAFFTGIFLPALQAAVLNTCSADPLDDFTVVSHSFGGLLLHLWLSSGHDTAKKVKRTVTVACPFYGYGGQIHRFFSGEKDLQPFYTWSELAKVCASMRGPYALMSMPHATWLRDRHVLERDQYPLHAYPVVDADDPQEAADPYDPQGSNDLVRYPTARWFDPAELLEARQILERITDPLPSEIAAKTHNWRGVRMSGRAVLKDTCCHQTWRLVRPDFDPDHHHDPITDAPGPGDDTIPAWSAHLAHTPAANKWTFTGDLHHVFLMQDRALLDRLHGLIESSLPKTAQPGHTHAAGLIEPVASRSDLESFIARTRTAQLAAGQAGADPVGAAAETLLTVGLSQSRALARRFVADMW